MSIQRRGSGTIVDNHGVASLWDFDNRGVARPFRGIILSEFRTKPSCLHAYHRVQLGIEFRLPAKNLRCNLIFLNGNAGMLDGLFGQVAEKFAKRFGAVKGMARHQTLDFGLELRSVSQSHSGDMSVTGAYQFPHLLAMLRFIPCNRIKPSDTYLTQRKVR